MEVELINRSIDKLLQEIDKIVKCYHIKNEDPAFGPALCIDADAWRRYGSRLIMVGIPVFVVKKEQGRMFMSDLSYYEYDKKYVHPENYLGCTLTTDGRDEANFVLPK